MSFELAFTDSIAAAPTTRLSLMGSPSGWQTLAEGTDFGTPSLKRAFAGSLLTDGQVVPASAYDNRTLAIQLEAPSALSADAAASLFQSLARELNRPNNFLRYRAGTTEPVFFRTFRGGLDAVDWDPLLKRATVRLLAEPFAYGVKESLAQVTVTNNPAAVSNGCYLDITGIKGDVETPAQVLLKGLDGGATFIADLIIGTRRRGTPSSGVYLIQCESMTLGTDTTLPGNDAVMSGAGSNYARSTFATASMQFRLTMNPFPAASGTDLRGNYRMYVMLRGDNASTFQLCWSLEAAASLYTSDTITLTPLSSTRRILIDLGRVPVPFGADPGFDGYSGVEKSITGSILRLQAARTAGAGNLDWDYVALVPDDPERGDDWFSARLTLTTDAVMDGPNDMVYPQNVGATTMPSAPVISRSGRTPMLSPGVNQRWIFLRPDRAGDPGSFGDRIGATVDVTVSYWPRYLSVRPLGT